MTVHTRGGSRPITVRISAAVLSVALCAVTWSAPSSAFAYTVTCSCPNGHRVIDPANIISESNFRATGSMSQADVQTFLNGLSGVLKNYSAPEFGNHGGAVKPASQIIWEAAQAWNLSPKVILTTLQKEQSLLTATAPSAATLDKAMGCGVYTGSPDRHPGFGDQVWTAAQKLSTYAANRAWTGAGAGNGQKWFPGMTIEVNFSSGDPTHVVVPDVGAPSFALYTYTPYIHGNLQFNDHYWRFFGDPLAPAFPPGTVFRFYNVKAGSHFYTASESERYRVIAFFASTYRNEGVAYSVNASNTANCAPLYRFCNVAKGTHFYTANVAERDNVIAKYPAVYRFEGVAYNVSLTPDGATPVWRFYNVRTGTHFYTANVAERDNVIAKYPAVYRFEGVAFYLAP